MKNYLIIGGSSGIGKAICETLESQGENVFATYFKKELPSTNNIKYFYLDVKSQEIDPEQIPEVIDGLVYCPGAINLKPFGRIKPEEFINDYDLQVVSAIKIIQKVIPNLKKSTSPSIVLFSTVAVQMGFSFHTLVSASKGAIEGLTRALAAELAPSIRVNCIAPSITDTPLAAGLLNSEEKKEANAGRHPLKKIGQAQDLAQMAVFLLGNQSSWITGQIFHVDGGMSSIKL